MELNNYLLGKRIKKLRKEQNISQIKFAEMIDKSPAFVSYLERGIKGVRLETLINIAEALNTSLDLLLAGIWEGPPQNTSDLTKQLEECTPYEQYVLLEGFRELMRILHEGRQIHDLNEDK